MLFLLTLLVFCNQNAFSSIIRANNEETLSAAATTCSFDPFSGGSPAPLLLQETSFLYPSGAGIRNIVLNAKESVDFACPGGTLVLANTKSSSSVVTATCVSGTTFTINSQSYTWSQIQCSANPTSTVQLTGNSCEADGSEIEIGYSVATNRFIRTILICFNTTNESPLYTYYDLIPAIDQQITGTPRPSFSQGSGIFSMSSVNTYYTQAKQAVTVNELLGLPSDSTTYVNSKTNYFLARGHFTARADFFYASQQNSTFFYQNCNPQWQTFNGFNWEKVETDVRDYAANNNVHLQVYTGPYGVTTLPHETTGVAVPLYLYNSGNTKALPVPEIYWKVVYNPSNHLGVVLIGVNNPYKNATEIDKFCTDVSSSLSWLTWEKDNQARGFSWACEVADFRKTVNHFPEFKVTGLLK
ncbi:hypothetical protein ABEB36_005416 [Hypothenemus hampei]|uniref:DNA/RNA non-specific endonuclease/pyrophosphatase/phosphodiesterase domain-containing protein n=1 Tax=Hypothenemus hampei TaxID=57062 RepID=A0ABD1EY58_HYPHA